MTRATIERYFDRLRRRDGWESCLADDMVFTSLTAPNRRVAGKAAYLEATKRFYGMISSFSVRELIVEGSRACALTHYTLQPPGGAPTFESDVAEVFEVHDGTIGSFTICFDPSPYPKPQPASQ